MYDQDVAKLKAESVFFYVRVEQARESYDVDNLKYLVVSGDYDHVLGVKLHKKRVNNTKKGLLILRVQLT